MWEMIVNSEIGQVVLKLCLSLLFGAALGIDRERKMMPAGFRTYMLVCLGSTIIMMTNMYLYNTYGTGDPARMGSQVVSGIGFLGAGTIIVTKNKRVRGLTTAAGLWAAAGIGLAVGTGFYTAAIIGGVLIFLILTILLKIDERKMFASKMIEAYVEFTKIAEMDNFFVYLRSNEIAIKDFQTTKSDNLDTQSMAALITIEIPKRQPHEEIVSALHMLPCVKYIEEL